MKPKTTIYTFLFRWTSTGEILATIKAYSKRQAIYKLSLSKGRSWIDDALESGRVDIKIKKNDPVKSMKKEPAGPTCPNCKSTNIIDGYDPGTSRCSDCGWQWETEVEEAINQLLKTIPNDTGAKPMTQAWQKALNTLLPVGKDVNEDDK